MYMHGQLVKFMLATPLVTAAGIAIGMLLGGYSF